MERENIHGDCSLVERTFSYVYPHREAVEWKRKYSVSELKRLSMRAPGEGERQDVPGEQPEGLPAVLSAWKKGEEEKETPKPAFLEKQKKKFYRRSKEPLSIKLWNCCHLERFIIKKIFMTHCRR